MQMVEIARAISYGSQIVIMDEPTSALSDKEVKVLYKLSEDLHKKGSRYYLSVINWKRYLILRIE